VSPAARRARGRPTVAVVGSGIAGLAAAWELTGGARGPDPDAPEVVVLEAGDRIGGKLATERFGDGWVDTAADGFLGRRPEAADLCREIGLGDALRPVGASGAGVVARGRLRPLPAGLVLGVPTRFGPLARSGILGPSGLARALLDVVAPRADRRTPLGDRAVGPLLARKLGTEVVTYLVDPVLGGIHAGSVSDMSTAAAFPLLLAVAQRRGSFMRSLRHAVAGGAPVGPAGPAVPGGGSPGGGAPGTGVSGNGADAAAGTPVGATNGSGKPDGPDEPVPPVPLFWSLDGGLHSLAATLAGRLEARGVNVRTESGVELLDRASSPSWTLHTAAGPVRADGVVLATPAGVTAGLLAPHDADAATLLGGIDYASVVVVTLAFPRAAVAEDLAGTGYVVPRPTTRPDGQPAFVTACTYLSQKWPHLARGDEVLVRASVGRIDDVRHQDLDDDQLVGVATEEVAAFTGITGDPAGSLVTRWPDSFPQYRVNHLLRVTGIEVAVERLPAVAVAGAAYRGIGIPACIASGRVAARAVRDALVPRPSGAGTAP
jgi:oxygen-dependent protoporphyrinogen oxidase